MKAILIATTLLALAAPFTSQAADTAPAARSEKATVQLSEGLILRVDKASGSLTISHGPLVNLQMGAMTMVFKVKNPAWLDQLSAGDKIRFLAEEVGGALVVTQLQR